MIYWINPGYIGGFFEDERLIVTGLGGLVWTVDWRLYHGQNGQLRDLREGQEYDQSTFRTNAAWLRRRPCRDNPRRRGRARRHYGDLRRCHGQRPDGEASQSAQCSAATS